MAFTNIFFAYTQTSFWDLLSSDPSFYDTSYKPSAFFYFRDVLESEKNGPWRLDMQSGFEHESNGRGGTGERSLNTIYLQPTLTLGNETSWFLTLQPRAWVYTSLSDNNPDMPDYRGYADLLATMNFHGSKPWERLELAAKLRKGDTGAHSGLTLDLRFNLPPVFGYTFDPAIQVEYFTGYGQTLRQYQSIQSWIEGRLVPLVLSLCLWEADAVVAGGVVGPVGISEID